MATGVLVLGVGRGTRLLGHLALTRKTYTATARLGVATTTDDADGDVTARRSTDSIDEQQLLGATRALVGELDQVPATVSAIKVDGQRAYARVRRGEQVRLAARRITVHRLDVTGLRRGAGQLDVDLVVECSSGTYVRALARDLGAGLGVGGHLVALRRTAVGPFEVSTAHTLPDLEANGVRLLGLAEAAGAVFATVVCDPEQALAVSHGRPLAPAPGGPDGPDGLVALVSAGGHLLALYQRSAGVARPVAVFEPA